MVPEPASLLIASMTQAAQETSTAIIPPAPFTTSADQLTELNYTIMAHAYEASGVTPPPERNASGAATSSKDGINQATSDSGLIQIPEGYEAKSCFVTVLTSVEDKGERVSVTVGTQSKMTQGEGIDSVDFTLANERGSVPWSVEAWNLKSYNVTFNLKYERTVTKFSEWQQATYGKILAAYKSKVRDTAKAEYPQPFLLTDSIVGGV